MINKIKKELNGNNIYVKTIAKIQATKKMNKIKIT